MECPRCGFRQPEDEFCAQCGVHIGNALRRRRRRNTAALGGTVVLLGAGAVGLTLWWSDQRRVTEPLLSNDVPDRPSIHRIQPPPPPPPGPQSAPKAQKSSYSGVTGIDKKGTKAPEAPAPVVSKRLAASPVGVTAEPPAQETDLENQLRRWAAQEWVTKGKEQAEGPEQELIMYRKAIEVDPHYAPAYYQIAMLYGLSGDREGALEALRKFWENATPEERVSLPLPEGVSPEDLAAPPAPPAGQ